MNHVLLFCGTGFVCCFRRFEGTNKWFLGFCDETKPAVATDGQPAIVGCASGCIFIMCGDDTNGKASHKVGSACAKTSRSLRLSPTDAGSFTGSEGVFATLRVWCGLYGNNNFVCSTPCHTPPLLLVFTSFHSQNVSPHGRTRVATVARHFLSTCASGGCRCFLGDQRYRGSDLHNNSVAVHANHIQRAIFFPVSNQPGFFHGEVPSRVLLRCAHRGQFSFLMAAMFALQDQLMSPYFFICSEYGSPVRVVQRLLFGHKLSHYRELSCGNGFGTCITVVSCWNLMLAVIV